MQIGVTTSQQPQNCYRAWQFAKTMNHCEICSLIWLLGLLSYKFPSDGGSSMTLSS